jgi:hypothetical protein
MTSDSIVAQGPGVACRQPAEGRLSTDKPQIRDAAAFFDRYRDGWINVWSGGSAPLYLEFFKGGDTLASFGVGPSFLSVGTMSRQIPETEITALAMRLGLTWPRPPYRPR